MKRPKSHRVPVREVEYRVREVNDLRFSNDEGMGPIIGVFLIRKEIKLEILPT